MPIDVSWFRKPRVMKVTFRGDIAVDEIHAAADEVRLLIDEAVTDNPEIPLIHMLQDAAQIDTFPKNLKKVVDAADAAYGHPNLGWVVAHEVHNRFVEFIGKMVSQIMKTRYRIVKTQDEALTFLQEQDQTLPPLDKPTDVKTNPVTLPDEPDATNS